MRNSTVATIMFYIIEHCIKIVFVEKKFKSMLFESKASLSHLENTYFINTCTKKILVNIDK